MADEFKLRDVVTSVDQAELFRSIGQYVFHFSRLEDRLKGVIDATLKLSDRQYDALMPSLDFAAACNICNAQSKALIADPDLRSELKGLISKCLAANDDRVRVAHGLWVVGRDSYVAVHTSRGSREKHEFFERPAELDEKATELRRRRTALRKFEQMDFSDPESAED